MFLVLRICRLVRFGSKSPRQATGFGLRHNTMMAPTNSRAQLIAAAQDLFPTLNGAWSESDADRRVPHRVVEEMRSAGLFRMVVPSELGGSEADLQTFLDVLHLVAYANGSGGWDLATSSMGSLFALGLPPEGIEQIYGGGPDVILAGTITLDRDAAKAIATNGGTGFRVGGGSEAVARTLIG